MAIRQGKEKHKADVRRAGHFSSGDIHRALFIKTPKARTLLELKEGIRHHIRSLWGEPQGSRLTARSPFEKLMSVPKNRHSVRQ